MTSTEILGVASLTQYGFRGVDGKNYSSGKFLKNQNYPIGRNIKAEVYTGPKGGKSINSWLLYEEPVLTTPAATLPPVPSVPSLPATSVAPKPNPSGVSPVAPVRADGNAMTKQDWNNRQDGISIDAIHKSVLESPAVANLVIGKSQSEVYDTVRDFFKFNLELNRAAKRGEL